MPINLYKKIQCENRNNKVFMVNPEIELIIFLYYFYIMV